jgi:hypothetical protein
LNELCSSDAGMTFARELCPTSPGLLALYMCWFVGDLYDDVLRALHATEMGVGAISLAVKYQIAAGLRVDDLVSGYHGGRDRGYFV